MEWLQFTRVFTLFIYLLSIGGVVTLNRQFDSPYLQLPFTQIILKGYFAIGLTE